MPLDEQRLFAIQVALAAIFARNMTDVSVEIQDDGAFLLAIVRFLSNAPVERAAIDAAAALLSSSVMPRPDDYAWMINFVDGESTFDSECGGWDGHR